MRFDDTNPEKEEQEYVDSILDAVQWLGFDWEQRHRANLYHASDYFDFMYRAAEYLIDTRHAYVDEQSAEQMRANARRRSTEPGTQQPVPRPRPRRTWRLFREMRDGEHADGSMVLRAKIDMALAQHQHARPGACTASAAPTHHNTGDKWCIYPMYTYAHPIEDALENITH